MNLYRDSHVMESLETIRNHITCVSNTDLDISDDDIWQIARLYDDIPNGNNIYYEQFISKFINLLCDTYAFLHPDHFTYDINDSATYFLYKDQSVQIDLLVDFDTFQDFIIRKAHEC